MFRRCCLRLELEPAIPWTPILPFQPTFFGTTAMTTPKTQERWDNLPELKMSADRLEKMIHGGNPAQQRWLRFKQQELADTSGKYKKAKNIGQKTKMIAAQYHKLFKNPEKIAATILKKTLKKSHQIHQQSLQVRRLIAERQQEKLMITAERTEEYGEWKAEWEEEWKQELANREKHKLGVLAQGSSPSPSPSSNHSHAITDGQRGDTAVIQEGVAGYTSVDSLLLATEEEEEEPEEPEDGVDYDSMIDEPLQQQQSLEEGEGEIEVDDREEDGVDDETNILPTVMVKDDAEEEEEAEGLSVYDLAPASKKKKKMHQNKKIEADVESTTSSSSTSRVTTASASSVLEL